MKIMKKIIAIIILCIQFIILGNSVNAANIDEIKNLERGPKGYYCVQKWDGSKWIYLTYNRTYYTDTNGQKYIAYCLSPGAPGVGYVSGEKETYQVKIKEILNNDIVWRIVKNGYPSKTVEQLGVETEDDAYFATMQAINCVLRGYTLEKAKELYSPGKFAINGENIADIQRRGNKTLTAMYNLIDIGLHGTEKRSDLLNVSIKTVTELKKENNEFYSQEFKVESSSEISEYIITNLEKFPEGTYVSDIKGNKKLTFGKGENFKIMVPKNKIINDTKGKISVKVNQKNYPVFYSESMLAGHQDYALCTNLYSLSYGSAEVYVQSNKSKLVINKIDKETKKPIKGVKFQIKSSNGDTNTYTTDDNGKIVLSNLKQGEIIIKETETVGKYAIDTSELKVNIGYDETKEIQIENKLKKGNVKIIKIDKDNEKIKLQNVKFKLIDDNGKTVKEGATDENGELEFKDIIIGKYKIVELETNKEYVISDEELVINIENNCTQEIIVKNELKKGNIKIIKIDENNEEIKLENVKFKLIDENGNIVKEGKTDENGELLFENIRIGKYKIIETETQEDYEILGEEVIVDVEHSKVKEIVIKNKKIPEEPKIPEIPVKPEEPQKIETPKEPVKPEEPQVPVKVVESKELPKTGNMNGNYINIINSAIFILSLIIAVIRNSLQHKKNNL